jgi:peptidoglycan/LPS O-acetylase OafA/YrhL
MAAGILYATHPVNNLRLYLNSSSFVFLVLGLAVHPWKLLVNPVVCSIGRLSYSVYLCHPYSAGVVAAVMLWASSRLGWPVYGTYLGLVLAFSVFLLTSLAIAAVTFPLVEQRGIDFGRRLTRRLSLPATTRAVA